MNRKPGDWNCPSCDHLNFGWRDVCQRCNEHKPSDGYSKPSKPSDGYGGRADDRSRGSYGFGSGYNSGGGSGGSSGSYYGRNQAGGGDYRSGYEGDYRGSHGGSDYNSRSYGGGFGGYGGSGGGSDVRPGDWLCEESACGAHNFASRSSCFKCGAAKDENGAANGRGGSYDYGRGGGYESRGSRGGFGKSYESADAGGRAGWKPGDWVCSRSGCNEHNFASRTECFRCQAPKET